MTRSLLRPSSITFHRIMQRHSFTALNSTFVVDAEYQFVKELGQGAYGCVVAAKHRRTGEGCAIKKITNINTKVPYDSTTADVLACLPVLYVMALADDLLLFPILLLILEDPHEKMFARDQVGVLSLLPLHTRMID